MKKRCARHLAWGPASAAAFRSVPEARRKPIARAIQVSLSFILLHYRYARLRLAPMFFAKTDKPLDAANYLAGAERLNSMPAAVNSDTLPSASRLKVKRV